MAGKKHCGRVTAFSWRELRFLRQEAWLNDLAFMPDGRPAWQAAKLLPGMKAKTFIERLKDGWSPERAATQPLFSQAGRPKFGAIRDPKEREFVRHQDQIHKDLGID